MGRHWTTGTGWQWTVIPFPSWKLTAWIVPITASHVKRCSVKVSAPQSQNFWNVPTTFDLLFLSKQQFSNEKNWCLKTKLWLKVIFSKCVQEHAETSAWFVHVTDCYCSGKRNLNEFFPTTKLLFVQSHPMMDGATLLNNFGCVYGLFDTEMHAQWNGCFPILKRETVVVEVCNTEAMWLW